MASHSHVGRSPARLRLMAGGGAVALVLAALSGQAAYATPNTTPAGPVVATNAGTTAGVTAGLASVAAAPADDADGDGLLDDWEINGYDADGDGKIDVNLPKMGADPMHKDVFVEMDYMGAEKTCPCHLPLKEDLKRIVKTFKKAPFANNPDGKKGIRIHLDAGKARGKKFNLGGGNLVPHDPDLNPVQTEFNALKSANFDSKRAKIFHYMIWAHGYSGGSSSGLSFGIPADSFIVTLGLWPNHGEPDVKVGTFIHELGHNLGLGHGGGDSVNYKPNYLSVMNYAFQVGGVPRVNKPPKFSYANALLPALNEASLDENVGLNHKKAKKFATAWMCGGSLHRGDTTANGPLDWNCNGQISKNVQADINGDGAYRSLSSYNDWDNIVYDGGTIGAGAETVVDLVMEPELTYEQYVRTHG